jgi:TonB family protein
MFEMQTATPRQPAVPAAVSAAAHLLIGAVAMLITMGLGPATMATERRLVQPARLVFIATPGPGGGGGGGGLRQPTPPPPAKREGNQSLKSPVPDREPPPPMEPPPAEPPPPEDPPTVAAPVVASAADDQDQPGILFEQEEEVPVVASQGPGSGGGVDSGRGTGIGEGQGSGIGPGSGGGVGGGPYRPGSGITPPSLMREVKPDYTDEARRRNVTGDVVLEIVVMVDGTVGDVRVLDGLGYGLDQRAVDAVRQWRFSPARRLGQPVDVLVEVAVEFRLR